MAFGDYNGYTCAQCGMWVRYGDYHNCFPGLPYVPPPAPLITIETGATKAQLEEVIKLLKEIKDLIETDSNRRSVTTIG